MQVSVVTDSTARFSSDIPADLPVSVVPLHITIGGRQYADGVDLNESELLRLAQTDTPRATPPTVEEFYRVYQRLHETTNEIISIHLPEKLSQTIANAQRAANMLLGQCKIEIIDSQTTSLGLGILAEAAARAAAEGKSLDEIVRYVRGLIPQIYLVFFSENLRDLQNADGIGPAQAILGTMLDIKPLFTLEEGNIIPIEKVRTRASAIEKLIEFVTEFDVIHQVAIIKNSPEATPETIAITEQLQETFPNLDVRVMAYGPVLASFIGSQALGVVVYEGPNLDD